MMAYIGLKTCMQGFVRVIFTPDAFYARAWVNCEHLSAGILFTPGEKRGGEDREFRLRSSLMHTLPRHDFRFVVSASHVFYALVLIL